MCEFVLNMTSVNIVKHRLNNNQSLNPHRLLDLAAEHMDPEDLSIVVALSEGKAVTLGCTIMTPHTEQNLIDGVVRNLHTVVGVQQPVKLSINMLLFDILRVSPAQLLLLYVLCVCVCLCMTCVYDMSI